MLTMNCRCLFIKTLVCLALLAGDVSAQKATVAEKPAKPRAARSRVAFDDVRGDVLLVRGGGSGSGFIMRDGEDAYLVTAIDTIGAATSVEAVFPDGEKLAVDPGAVDVSSVGDILRFKVATDRRGLVQCGEEPTMGENVTIVGDGDGHGVFKETRGRITGIGPQILETSAHYGTGCSGAPVLNSEGELLGVAVCKTAGENVGRTGGGKKTARLVVRTAVVQWNRSKLPIQQGVAAGANGTQAATRASYASQKAYIEMRLFGRTVNQSSGSFGEIKVDFPGKPSGSPFLSCAFIVDFKKFNNTSLPSGYAVFHYTYDLQERKCVKGDASKLSAGAKVNTLEKYSYHLGGDESLIFPSPVSYYRIEVWCGGVLAGAKEGVCNGGLRPTRLPPNWHTLPDDNDFFRPFPVTSDGWNQKKYWPYKTASWPYSP